MSRTCTDWYRWNQLNSGISGGFRCVKIFTHTFTGNHGFLRFWSYACPGFHDFFSLLSLSLYIYIIYTHTYIYIYIHIYIYIYITFYISVMYINIYFLLNVHISHIPLSFYHYTPIISFAGSVGRSFGECRCRSAPCPARGFVGACVRDGISAPWTNRCGENEKMKQWKG